MNAGRLLVATLGAGVVNYGYALTLTHGLTPAQYASFAAGQALLVAGAAITGAGLPWVIAREVAIDPTRQAAVLAFAFWANLALGAALATVLGGAVLIFGTPGSAFVVAAATMIISAGSALLGHLQGTGRMTLIAALLAGETVVKAGVGVTLVFGTPLGATGALLGFAAGGLVLLVPLPAVRHLIRRPAWEPALLRAAIHQTRLQAGVAVLAAGDTVLAATLGLAGAGPYQAASALGRVPLFAANALSTAAFPQLSRDRAAAHGASVLRSYLLVAVFLAGALATLPAGLRELVFPATFRDVGRWLPWTALLGLMLGAINLTVTFLQAGDVRRGPATAVAAITAGYLLLISAAGRLGGIAGLAAGAALAATLSAVLLARFPSVRDAVRLGPVVRHLAPVLPVVAALAVCGLCGSTAIWLAIAIPAGLAVLAAAFPDLRPTTFAVRAPGRVAGTHLGRPISGRRP